MIFHFTGLFVGIGLLIGMVLCLEAGRRIGAARLIRHPEGLAKGGGTVEAAVYGLLGLLVALTFTGAVSRFEARRHLVTQEGNAISTAYLRIDLLPAAAQPHMRQLFRAYLDSRLKTYQKLPDLEAAKAELARSYKLQGAIWSSAIAACSDSCAQAAQVLLLPALNKMFDITTSRYEAVRNHPPLVMT